MAERIDEQMAGAFYHVELQILVDAWSWPHYEYYRTFEDAMDRIVFINTQQKNGVCKFTVTRR